MLAIHYCSDREQTLEVLRELLQEVKQRVAAGTGVLAAEAARIFWVNPVADLQAMNLLEETGGRLCGTELLFCHALDEIPTRSAADGGVGADGAGGPDGWAIGRPGSAICRDAKAYGAEAVVISRIPGASHCAWEGRAIAKAVSRELGHPGH